MIKCGRAFLFAKLTENSSYVCWQTRRENYQDTITITSKDGGSHAQRRLSHPNIFRHIELYARCAYDNCEGKGLRCVFMHKVSRLSITSSCFLRARKRDHMSYSDGYQRLSINMAT